MKKILLATTAVVLSAGFASAEVTLSGSAHMGLDYTDSATAFEKTTTLKEVIIGIGAVVETDSGLTFGVNTALNMGANDGASSIADDGTSVYVKGAFGKLTFGDVGEADEMAGGLSDIGLSGIGVDDVAENYTGDSSKGQRHNVNYSHSVGDFSFAISTALGLSTSATNINDGYAIGAKYAFGDYYVGVGYNVTNLLNTAGARDGKTSSVYAGGKMGAFGVKAMYASFDPDAAGASVESYGINMNYTTGAATISLAYADSDAVAKAAYGLGVSYDLGAGAAVVGGIGSVGNVTRAQVGVSFEF